jgi:hypothetical protein
MKNHNLFFKSDGIVCLNLKLKITIEYYKLILLSQAVTSNCFVIECSQFDIFFCFGDSHSSHVCFQTPERNSCPLDSIIIVNTE